jgi:hypothetical protein
MKRLITPPWIVAFLFVSLSSWARPGLGQEDPGEVARRALEEFRKQFSNTSDPSKSPREAPSLTWNPTFWHCSDGDTELTVDLRGNASCKRQSGWSPGERASGVPPSGSLGDAALVRKTRELAVHWLAPDQVRSFNSAVKRETLLLAQLPGGKIAERSGRILVRLTGPDDIGEGSFQAVFDPEGHLLRMDIAFANARSREFCTPALLARAQVARRATADDRLTLGCFFDPAEYRFEISAFSVEGEPFLDLRQTSNPFGRDGFDLKAPHRVSVLRYRDSQDYHWWCWAWWYHYGCVGGFRGNWLKDQATGHWEFPHHEVLHHRSLSSYAILEGAPRRSKVIQHPDGPATYPHAISQHFGAAFYRDLEACNVAFLFTHAGPIQGVYQVRRGPDVWVVLATPRHTLGVGKLRHLFLDGCAAFTFRREPQAAHLLTTWIRRAPANGVRTVCGVDGGASLLDRSGWRFFGHYNKGESISDAWAFAILDESVENCPATAAYGKTTDEAVECLLKGRFSNERAEAKAVAISVWSGTSKP